MSNEDRLRLQEDPEDDEYVDDPEDDDDVEDGDIEEGMSAPRDRYRARASSTCRRRALSLTSILLGGSFKVFDAIKVHCTIDKPALRP